MYRNLPTILSLIYLLQVGPKIMAQENSESVIDSIYRLDSSFWQAYNTCDIKHFRDFLADDLEFYHDKGGITRGGDSLAASLERNLCSKPGYHLRREVIPASVKISLLKKQDNIYGAIIEGEHLFYVIMDRKPEYLDGQANFLTLWLKENNSWQMSRVMSYNHHAPAYKSERKKVQVSASDLSKLTGRYGSKKFGLMEVVIAEDHLLLNAGKQKFVLLPQSPSSYFTPDRDLVFDFLREVKIKAQNVTVTENGKLEDTLLREN